MQVESDSRRLEAVLSWLESLYRPSIPWSVWLEIQTAIGEGFDNAVRHAHRGLPQTTPVEIALGFTDDRIAFQIWDHGPGFDFETLMANLPDHADLEAVSGRGFCILRRVADRLEYAQQLDRRNRLYLEKHFTPMLAAESPTPNAQQPQEHHNPLGGGGSPSFFHCPS